MVPRSLHELQKLQDLDDEAKYRYHGRHFRPARASGIRSSTAVLSHHEELGVGGRS